MRFREKIVFYLSAFFLIATMSFAYGAVVGKYEIWPFSPLSQMKEAAISYYKNGGVYPKNLVFSRYQDDQREQLTLVKPEGLAKGYIAIMHYNATQSGYVVTLLDSARQVTHQWPIIYSDLDPDGPTGKTDQPHGLYMMSDGSLLVNFDRGDVMARLDPCGEAIWVKPGNFHHAIGNGLNGTLWTWSSDYDAYSPMQYLVNFNPENGETIRSIGLVEDVIQNSDVAALHMTIPADFNFAWADRSSNLNYKDIFHPNDIEALPIELAHKFPMFEAGDLMLSMRELHMVVIIDPITHEIKWVKQGPWRFQHDPDFNADGTISVYSNNSYRRKSSIISVDPKSDTMREIYTGADYKFFSDAMGKHTILPNGNALILSAGQARVTEVNENGEIVFEFLNVLSERLLGHVQNAIWLPEDYFSSEPTCH